MRTRERAKPSSLLTLTSGERHGAPPNKLAARRVGRPRELPALLPVSQQGREVCW